MKTLRMGLVAALTMMLCLVFVSVAHAEGADYYVRPGESVNVTLQLENDDVMDGQVVVSGGPSYTFTTSDGTGGINANGKFYLYMSTPCFVTTAVTAPTDAQPGDTYTVTYYYDEYDTMGDPVEMGRVRSYTVEVYQDVPAVIAPAASDIALGQALSDSILTGGSATFDNAEVAGTFAWTDATTTPATEGTWEYTVVFTPDSPAYASVSMTVPVTVQPTWKQYLSLGFNLDLADEIAINMFITPKAAVEATNLRLESTFTGGMVGSAHTISLNQLVSEGAYDSATGQYLFRVAVCAACEMVDEVSFHVYLNDTEELLLSGTYSIREYCNRTAVSEESSNKLKSLCLLTLDYGAYAQTFFNYRVSSDEELANRGVYTYGSPSAVENNFPCDRTNAYDLIGAAGFSLNLESRTEMNFFFKPGSGAGVLDYRVSVGGTVLQLTDTDEPVESGNYKFFYTGVDRDQLCLTIKGITAPQLGEQITVDIGREGSSVTAQLVASPMSYARYISENGKVAGGTDNPLLTNVCRALNDYYLAAVRYYATVAG